MDFHSLEGPAPYSGKILPEKLASEEKVEQETLSLFKHLPFADRTLSTSDKNFITKKVPTEDELLGELDKILKIQATQIDKALHELEHSEKGQKLVEAFIEAEGWGSLGYESLETSVEGVEQGIEFLEHVLPHHLVSNLPHYKFEKLKGLTALGNVFLSALESGSEGLSLLCRSKLLEHSRHLLEQLKETYDPAKTQTFSPEELKKVKKTLLEWEVNIKMEERALKEEMLDFKINTAYSVLYLSSLSLVHFPKELALEYTQPIVAGMSWAMAGLEVVTYGLEVAKTHKDSHTFHQWTDAYQKWQEQHQPTFTITEQGVQRKRVSVAPIPRPFRVKEHQQALFQFLEKAKDIHHIRQFLKDFDIELDPSLTSKEVFFSCLQTDPAYRYQLVQTYVHFQRKLEALNLVIQTSENLLTKRQAIIQKKMVLLYPHFQAVESKIQELKKTSFIRDMQQLLWQQIPDLPASTQEIKQHLQRWGFYASPLSEKAQKVLQAFEQVEQGKYQEISTPLLLEQQQHFMQEFAQWMEDSNAMDGQFQVWYQRQPREDLLRFYVDHQETIEQTTKNALKQMVQKKHEVEDRFIHFKHIQSSIHLSVATISLTVSIALAILGLLSIPFGGAGLILLILSVGSSTVSLGLSGANYLHTYYHKPHTTTTYSYLYQIRTMVSRLGLSIHHYFHQAKEKKLLEVSKILHKLHASTTVDKQQEEGDYQKALADFKKAKSEFNESEEKVNEWSHHLKRLEARLAEKSWQDFTQQASLKIGENPGAFDTLHSFQEALQACDLRLLSEETKTLLKVQLGMDLEALQAQIEKNPAAIKETLKDFFILDDAHLVSFIKNQKTRIKKESVTSS